MSSLQLVPTSPKPLIRFTSASFPICRKLYAELLSNKKTVFISLGFGALLFGLASKYLRRRRRRGVLKPALVNHNDVPRHRKNKPLTIRTPSGEIHNLSSSPCGAQANASLAGVPEKGSLSSVLTTKLENGSGLTPQQYGLMGVEALEGSIGLWEEALSSYRTTNAHFCATALPTQEEAEFTQCLQKVIDEAYSLQEQCEQLFLHQQSILFRSFDVTPELSEVPIESMDRRTLTSISSLESFVSAQADIADLRDLEEFEDCPPALYLAAMKHHEDFGIPYRDVRTEWVHCENDVDYLCKVHCLRLACHVIFGKADNKEWFIKAGRKIIECLLLRNDKDPKDALAAYDELLLFLQTCDWVQVEKELQSKGVRALTFYDVVLDFILMDAFDDLENPPSSVVAVAQNRWLSNGFKESALSTAVWSVLKAKRRMLAYKDGLISHFYDITEHLSPALAWGFLGTDFRYKETCVFFKDQVQSLVRDMFNYHTVRYTTVFHLSDDLVCLAKQKYEVLMDTLSLNSQANGTIETISHNGH